MIADIDITLFEAANQIAGRSFTLDALMALAMENPLVKGGPIAACFLFAWWYRADAETLAKRRATLLLTLAALFLIAPVMKLVSSQGGLSPRPLVQSERTIVLESGALRPLSQVAYTAPETGLAAGLTRGAKGGTVAPNDLASFPSDHAALFAAFAAGIFLAMRTAGLVALGWGVFGIMLPRVATGMHWPSDMAAGALAGLAVLAAVLLAGRTVLVGPVAAVQVWAEKCPGWTQALLFLLLAEVASAMGTLQRLAELASGILGR
ncbi:phosphatase PAP2 family protein [Qipengyuania marisflavi]|uniref:Phosphatase PAP2 family protein n=1 Tax=Qipengyuania marisflavi TaxID=2486356 RepID=A0A5S3P766_9SPHN|nr:phosphatase PAP2 family protein [Qipengyuania marisflavi]TMM49073.1 phosphatase PAP2 family protein [Qipengyuania marisflavi]